MALEIVQERGTEAGTAALLTGLAAAFVCVSYEGTRRSGGSDQQVQEQAIEAAAAAAAANLGGATTGGDIRQLGAEAAKVACAMDAVRCGTVPPRALEQGVHLTVTGVTIPLALTLTLT